MRLISITAALVLLMAFGTSAAQQGPDITGRWNRDPTVGSVTDARWGSRVDISQLGKQLTVVPSPGKQETYRLDGTETAEAISVHGCANKTRVTKAVAAANKITITTWIVTKSNCVHGEDEDDPIVNSLGVVDPKKVFGQRKLESISDVYRDGDFLTVETTRAAGGGEATTTRTAYRK